MGVGLVGGRGSGTTSLSDRMSGRMSGNRASWLVGMNKRERRRARYRTKKSGLKKVVKKRTYWECLAFRIP